MGLQIRGFATIDSLIDNSDDTVALLGELSEDSRTYSRDVTEYFHDTNKELSFVCMQRVDENNSIIDIPEENLESVMTFIEWMWNAGKDGTITTDRATFLNNWMQKFPDMADSYDCGSMRADTEYILPEWCSWTLGDDVYQIVFCDEVMEAIWEPYEIIPICPVNNLDDLLQTIETAEPIVNSRSLTTTIELMNTAKGDDPYTSSENYELTWYQFNDSAKTMETDWVVLQYGPNARDPENIRNAIRDWIIANSESNEVDWYPVYPELFDPTMFYMVPLWDNIAIDSKTTTEGIYSPVVNPVVDAAKVKLFVPASDEHLKDALQYMATRYNCVSVASVGAEGNKEENKLITDLYPDYLSVAMGNPDFYRQSAETQIWQEGFFAMIKAAEDYEPGDTIPADMSTSIKEGLVYMTKVIDGNNYLMITKQSYLNAVANANGDNNNGGSEIG